MGLKGCNVTLQNMVFKWVSAGLDLGDGYHLYIPIEEG
jgi:hypothetical protein